MATLYKRASRIQMRMLRIIEGAVRNTLDAHPDICIYDEQGPIDHNRFARSIAKRAVGTLSSQLDDVLALGEQPCVKPEEVTVSHRPSI